MERVPLAGRVPSLLKVAHGPRHIPPAHKVLGQCRGHLAGPRAIAPLQPEPDLPMPPQAPADRHPLVQDLAIQRFGFGDLADGFNLLDPIKCTIITPGLDMSAYRIVQEALTNVLKHAGPGARTEVRLGTEPGGIVIEVLDDGKGLEPPSASAGPFRSAGHGIVGMRERALLLGGTLDARPRPGGGFRVVAQLPTGGEPA